MALLMIVAGLGEELIAYAADALVLLGLIVTTLGVVGIFRMPDAYTQLHASGKAVFLGIIAFLVASLASRDPAIATRALLIAVFLILTTPVAAHVIARASFERGDPMSTPGAVDESGADLTRGDDAPPPEEPPDRLPNTG